MGIQVLGSVSELREVMVNTYHEALKLGYPANYFLQMIGKDGPVLTAKELVNNRRYSSGFTRLWELKRLDLSVEAIILREEFQHFFDADDLGAAKRKLVEVGY